MITVHKLKKKKTVIFGAMFAIALLLIGLLVVGDDEENPDLLNWYEVEDWEIAECSQKSWNGLKKITQTVTVADSYNLENYSSEFIISLQAQISKEFPDGTKVYQVSWYFQPTELDVTTPYEVMAYYSDDSLDPEMLATEIATYSSDFNGFWGQQTDKNMSHVVLRFDTQEQSGNEFSITFI